MSFTTLQSLRALCVALSTSALCAVALAAGDAGIKPPSTPPSTIVDKGPRCLPAAVNECRLSCERKKHDTSDKAEIGKKQNECKQDCIRGC